MRMSRHNRDDVTMMKSINPATGQTLDEFDELTDSELDACLERAAHAFEHNRLASFAERARRMSRAAEILESEKNDLGKLVDDGKLSEPGNIALTSALNALAASLPASEGGD